MLLKASVRAFLLTGFLVGSVSSTITFFDGAGGIANALTCVRRWANSASLEVVRFSMRWAKERRAVSNELRSLESDWNSSLEPNAPADSTSEPKTSNKTSRLRYSLNVAVRSSGEARNWLIISGSAFCKLRWIDSTLDWV